MDFIRRFIEQKISHATGAEVRFGKLSFSPLSGVIEVQDLCVGTFLTVKKIEAKIVVARALKQEIVVRSLAIEGPAIAINRLADGTINLPARPSRENNSVDSKKSWEFEAHKVLLINGSIGFTDASGYRISLENLTGSVEMKPEGTTEFIFAADSLGRRDKPVELGEARLLGNLAGGLNLSLTAGSTIDVSVRTPAMDSGLWDGEINVVLAIQTLLALLPPNVNLPITTATGEARLSASGHFDRKGAAFNLDTFNLQTGSVTIR